ncbi:MAG: hypothetical protein BWX81_00064 [Spirochaetes bacterium ADurb.Bin110]|nr:MAG: hypothetical protein BWX81_00064 [Spirochaetes bacterium ADurb.Bin110]
MTSVAVLLPGLSLVSAGFKKATIIFLVAGAAILLATGQPFSEWLIAINSMTNTVAIMVAMQLVAIPISIGRYDERICQWANQHARSNTALFSFSTLVTHLFASFLNMGAIPLSMNLMGKTIRSRLSGESADRFLAVTVSRGYVLAALWAPPAINLYLVGQATGIPWSQLLMPGILLAMIGFGLSYWAELRHGVIAEKSKNAGRANALSMEHTPNASCNNANRVNDIEVFRSSKIYHSSGRNENAAMLHVGIAALSIAGIVFFLEKKAIGASYTRIMLAGALVSAIWSLALHDSCRFRRAAHEYWDDGLLKVRDMGPFFVAMGIFSRSLQSSGILDAIAPFIQHSAGQLGLFAVVLLPLVMTGLSVIGFHPFITIVLFGTILAATPMKLPMLSIALSLAVGGAASYMISPFAGIIMSISRYTGAKASQISIKWNGAYSIAFFIVGVLFAIAWGTIIGR